MMNIDLLKKNEEKIAEQVHNAWWLAKKEQGFHAPDDCISDEAKKATKLDLTSHGLYERLKFSKFCEKCHTDMYSYSELPENIKDYDRVTVQAVLDAIEKLASVSP